ncbi:PHA/PHB synthase family protein [Legionella sp. W05-934-2]|jgi:polyhydroxyalkanoate synthase|uniref:PHA/PHB synthase family protein n=1 Tax=Legionella sp. W05-934-2 TaxID=1198649 RepID=UPI0034631652
MDREMVNLMQTIASKSMQLVHEFYQQPTPQPLIIKQFIDLSEDYFHFLQLMFSNPEKLYCMQVAYWQEAMSLVSEQMSLWAEGKVTQSPDKRFADESWATSPFFYLLWQQYMLAAKHIQQLVDSVEYKDKKTAKKIAFFTKQYLDALSPSNYIQTNPVLLQETMQSGGKNILQGLKSLLEDLHSGKAHFNVKMTDYDAFQVGKNIASTPGKVIFENDIFQLIQYSPMTDKVKAVPLLIIPPWINKYYILDLSEDNSLVRYLVGKGMTVFMISWVNPDEDHKDVGFFDYMTEGALKALTVVKQQTQQAKVNMLGFCVGGTLLSCLLAYLKAKNDHSVQSATFLTSLIDFSDPGDLGIFIDEDQIQILEDEMNKKGYLDGRFMATTFNSLRANDLIWSFFIKNYLQGKNPVPFDILYWNNDSTHLPAKMHSQYLRWMYLHNDLIKPNQLSVGKTALDVHQIDTPSFFVSTEKDHIALWQTTYNGFLAFNGEKQFVLGGSGHIAGIINPPSPKKKYGYYTNPTLDADAQTWLKQASHHQGSWWPYWLKWLKSKSGGFVPARSVENGKYKPIENAPGSYVMVKKGHIQ